MAPARISTLTRAMLMLDKLDCQSYISYLSYIEIYRRKDDAKRI